MSDNGWLSDRIVELENEIKNSNKFAQEQENRIAELQRRINILVDLVRELNPILEMSDLDSINKDIEIFVKSKP